MSFDTPPTPSPLTPDEVLARDPRKDPPMLSPRSHPHGPADPMGGETSHWEPVGKSGPIIICTYGEHRADVPAVAILSTAEGTWDGSAACEHHINEPRAF